MKKYVVLALDDTDNTWKNIYTDKRSFSSITVAQKHKKAFTLYAGYYETKIDTVEIMSPSEQSLFYSSLLLELLKEAKKALPLLEERLDEDNFLRNKIKEIEGKCKNLQK